MSENDKDLGEGEAKVLQALLGSMASNASLGSHPGQTVPLEKVMPITDKLDALLRGHPSGEALVRNELGQAVSEEGLPIVEITEPLPDDPQNTENPRVPEPVPITSPASLSEDQRKIRQRDVNRILDDLEEEERAWEDEQRRKQEEEEAAARLRSQPSTQPDRDRLQAQREMQKKMGKALLANMAAAREREEETRKAKAEAWAAHEHALRPDPGAPGLDRKPRKTVSFAELPKEGNGEPRERLKPRKSNESVNWGDVMPGHLKASTAHAEGDPMRRDVVERHAPRRDDLRSPIVTRSSDSDDESDYGNSLPEDGLSDSEDTLPGDDNETESDEQGDFNVVDDDIDFDAAQHHREIALRYHEKRATMGTQIVDAMALGDHEGGEHDWDQPEVPLEASLAREPPKPATSRFKAARASHASSMKRKTPSASNPISIAGAGIPAAQMPDLKRVVRVGKLEGDQLAGGPAGDSGSEDETTHEVIDMLRRGEITNMGPLPTSTDVHERERSPILASGKSMQTAALSSTPSSTDSVDSAVPNPAKPRVSHFKQTQQHPSSAPLITTSGSPASTPLSTVDRSSPKLSDYPSDNPVSELVAERSGPSTAARANRVGTATPIIAPTPTSRPPERIFPSPPPPSARPSAMPSMIVDSPSFPPAKQSSSAATVPAWDAKPRSRFMLERDNM